MRLVALPAGATMLASMPPEVIFGAGYVHGIPRLDIPALRESDASLGVSYVMGLRKDDATALASGMLMGQHGTRQCSETSG
jgi:beta-glucosidase